MTGSIPPLRTLIADESRSFSAVLERWIENRPELAWIGTVRTGPEAIEAARSLNPELVLIDLVLPEIDGLRVLRELRLLPRPPLAVVVTFQANDHARQAALEAGASGFVAKDELADAMELLLPELLASEGLGSTVAASVSPPTTPGRPGSRTERVP